MIVRRRSHTTRKNRFGLPSPFSTHPSIRARNMRCLMMTCPTKSTGTGCVRSASAFMDAPKQVGLSILCNARKNAEHVLRCLRKTGWTLQHLIVWLKRTSAVPNASGERLHKQQSPIALLLRLLLASTNPGDWIPDPFAGTGTTGVVAEQLSRSCVLIENAHANIDLIRRRLASQREADPIARWRHYYRFTPELDAIWPVYVESTLEHTAGGTNVPFA